MPESEATLAKAAAKLAEGRGEIVEALDGLRGAMDDLRQQLAADLAAQTRGTRRRIVVAMVLVLAVLAAVAGTGSVWVARSRDQAATAEQFDALTRERQTNCLISQTRTQVQGELVRHQLDADRASLALLTGPGRSPEIAGFAHVVFDGKIAAAERYLRDYPAAPITCTVPGR